ncbi:ABC transporter permease [Facklamia sp. DSM 111018]|uniref:ABC transporter permease n=1 Tax=Facklamia lactis TaxID=2749967 RepID=A0ABS0LTG2_9LACT|nr:ABC transporter permease [Facklamia lactis]MBG9986569.1 ABC transporter permease [Facklamia lactis]
MQVFNLFFKLLRDSKFSFILNLAILIFVTIITNPQNNSNLDEDFSIKQSNLAIFNYDKEDPISQDLIDYLQEKAEVTYVNDSDEAIADAFYNEKISYALTIPEGFGASMIDAETQPISLEKQVIKSEMDEINMDIIINSYLTNLDLLATSLPEKPNDTDLQTLTEQVRSSLEESEITVIPSMPRKNQSKLLTFGVFFIPFISYTLISTCITGFGTGILSMRHPEIVKRDRLSIMTEGKRWRQTLLACIVFSWIFWLLLILIACAFYGPSTLFSQKGILLIIASLINLLGIQSLSYFLVTLAPNKGMVNFLSTFVSILIAFSSGSFIDLNIIAKPLKTIASIATPIWNVYTNEILLYKDQWSYQDWQQIATYSGIQLLIAGAYFALSLVIQQYRHRHNIFLSHRPS